MTFFLRAVDHPRVLLGHREKRGIASQLGDLTELVAALAEDQILSQGSAK